jgi:hypothetical protein
MSGANVVTLGPSSLSVIVAIGTPGASGGVGSVVGTAPIAVSTAASVATVSLSPLAGATISSSGSLPSPGTDITYPVITSGGAVTVTVTGTPVAGVKLTFWDVTKTWATNGFTFTAQSGAVVRNPGALSGGDTNSVTLTLSGASATFQWFPGVGGGTGTWASV